MNWTLVILGVILLVVIYILYKVIKEKGKTVAAKLNLTTTNDVMAMSKLVTPNSSRYYLMTWILVESKASQPDTMFKIQNSDGSTVKLSIKLDTTSKLTYAILDNGSNTTTHTIMENFPLQKWVCVVLSIDGDVVDIYIDGKMTRSQKLAAMPKAPTKDDQLVYERLPDNTSVIYLAKFEREAKPMDPALAWNKYMEGHGGSYFSKLLSNYGASFTITKDDLDVRTFNMF
jgi:hypothetical protein